MVERHVSMTTLTQSPPLPSIVQTFINNTLEAMHGWCTRAKAEALANLILEHKPEHCLEIGVFAGRSLLTVALCLHVNQKGTVYGIDPWDAAASIAGWEGDQANKTWWENCPHDYIEKEARRYVREFGVDRYVKFIKATSAHTLAGFQAASDLIGRPLFQFIHIDGNHCEQTALADVEGYAPLLCQDGILVFDDVNWSSTKAAQKRLLDFCDEIGRVEADNQACGVFQKR